jgi:hypothetical protein
MQININDTDVSLPNFSLPVSEENVVKSIIKIEEPPPTPKPLTRSQTRKVGNEFDHMRPVYNPDLKTTSKLMKYLNHPRFATILKENGLVASPNHVKNMSPVSQERLLNDIRYILASRYTDKVVTNITTHGVDLAERLLKPYYDIEGMAELLKNMDEYQELIDELIVETELPHVNPFARFMLIVMQAAMIQFSINKIKNNFKQSTHSRKTESSYRSSEFDSHQKRPGKVSDQQSRVLDPSVLLSEDEEDHVVISMETDEP